MYLELNERNPQGKSMASILVIDDDRAVLATIKVLLERAVHSIEAVDSSRAGLKLLETRAFDLLIVDIFMPGMDGFETMKLVHQSHPDMPVIVISGQQFALASERPPDFLHMATRLGAVSSLQKPFRPAELLAAVNSSLSSSHSPPSPHQKAATGIPSERQ
jgi:CheY-like chemotaxis protein